MSWLLKQAEDILNRVDQQTNAAIHQHGRKSVTQQESISEASTSNLSNTSSLNFESTNRSKRTNLVNKKNDDSDLFDYLNKPTPINDKPNRPSSFNNSFNDTTRTASSPNIALEIASKSAERVSSKSASNTPRSTTPGASTHDDDDEGLVLVSLTQFIDTLE